MDFGCSSYSSRYVRNYGKLYIKTPQDNTNALNNNKSNRNKISVNKTQAKTAEVFKK